MTHPISPSPISFGELRNHFYTRDSFEVQGNPAILSLEGVDKKWCVSLLNPKGKGINLIKQLFDQELLGLGKIFVAMSGSNNEDFTVEADTANGILHFKVNQGPLKILTDRKVYWTMRQWLDRMYYGSWELAIEDLVIEDFDSMEETPEGVHLRLGNQDLYVNAPYHTVCLPSEPSKREAVFFSNNNPEDRITLSFNPHS